MAFMFENLDVYQKAVDFADRIAELTERFPRGYRYLADQLSRASLSVAANIAEGNGRFTKADRKNFFIIARGSVHECVPLLELARRVGRMAATKDGSESERMMSGHVSMWDADGGKAARCYAEKPYGHYKEEIYPFFGEVLDALGDGIRVLDVGAGPGHLAFEFYKKRPASTVRFSLMEAGQALLDIAKRRMRDLGIEIECFQRDFNLADWQEGLGKYDAVVSNNAIFNVKPELLGEFYGILFGLLNKDGLLMNQQSCAYEDADFADAVKSFPNVLAPSRFMSDEETERFATMNAEQRRLNEAALEKAKEQAELLRGEGKDVGVQNVGYANIHLPASVHVSHMRKAGFVAGCIWRKMNFVVLVAIKGNPFGR